MARALVALAVAVAACLLSASASGGGPLQTAVAESIDFDSSAVDLLLDRVHGAGATFVRETLPWYKVAPKAPPAGFDASNPSDPAYDWSAIDDRVTRTFAHGLEPFLVIDYPPAWAKVSDAAAAPPRPSDLAQFAQAAADRYSGKYPGLPHVRYWQIWLEPNVNVYFRPQFSGGQPVSPGRYAAMVDAAANAIHGVDPTDSVIAGGLSPFTVSRGETQTIGPMRFMRLMLCMSAGAKPHPTCSRRVHFDIWSHHPYTSGGPTHHAINPDDVSLGDLPKMKTLLVAAYRAGHIVTHAQPGFWVTEFSWDTNPPDPKAVPIKLAARWTSEALYQMWKVGISLVTWLKLRDDPYPDLPTQSGLYFRGASIAQDKPKPSLTAFRFPFVAYRQAGLVYVWGRTPWGKPSRVAIDQDVGGRWKRIVTLATDRYGIFSAMVAGRAHGYMRASLVAAGVAVAGSRSLPFSLRRPPDHFYNPFG
jgi:hypothetical protein